MPRTKSVARGTQKRVQNVAESEGGKRVAMDAAMADNLNSNHSKQTVENRIYNKVSAKDRNKSKNTGHTGRRSQQFSGKSPDKSTLQNNNLQGHDRDGPEVVQFEEGDDLVQMEIDDGGATAVEFARDYEEEGQIVSDSETDHGSGHQYNTETEDEHMDSHSEPEVYYTVCSQVNVPDERRVIDKQTSDGDDTRRQSVQQKLDDMSNTLQVMKDFFMKQDFMDDTSKEGIKKGKNNKNSEATMVSLTSEMTVYHNALPRVAQNEVIVDSEITFRVDPKQKGSDKRGSSFSEEHIDTSDEMIDIDDMDINECFIADFQAEARKRSSGGKHHCHSPNQV